MAEEKNSVCVRVYGEWTTEQMGETVTNGCVWVRGIWRFFVLFLQFLCKFEMIFK